MAKSKISAELINETMDIIFHMQGIMFGAIIKYCIRCTVLLHMHQ